MISALSRLRRGLLALAVLSLVVTLCPCLACAETPAHDCCASDVPSLSGACCAEDGAAKTTFTSTTVFVPVAAIASAHPMVIDAAVPFPVHAYAIPDRPVVARAVLRI